MYLMEDGMTIKLESANGKKTKQPIQYLGAIGNENLRRVIR